MHDSAAAANIASDTRSRIHLSGVTDCEPSQHLTLLGEISRAGDLVSSIGQLRDVISEISGRITGEFRPFVMPDPPADAVPALHELAHHISAAEQVINEVALNIQALVVAIGKAD